MSASKARARELFERFTGAEADEDFTVKVRVAGLPKHLTLLGELHAIEYVISKQHDLEGPVDAAGEPPIYRHEFEPGSILASVIEGRGALICLGDFEVLEEGITG